MLEDLAIRYVSADQSQLKLLSYALIVVGGAIGGIFHRSELEMQRGTYFAFTGCLFLAAALSQLIWIGSVESLIKGTLWVLMSIDLATSLVLGYLLAVIAMARSRDATENARSAFAAFIPLANLWLMLKPSKSLSGSPNRYQSFLSGGTAVLVGIVALAASTLVTKYAEREIAARIASAESNPEYAEKSLLLLIAKQGLEQTIVQIAAEVKTPEEINKIIRLDRVYGDGGTLRYEYIKTTTTVGSDNERSNLISNICRSDLRGLISAGATVEFRYLYADGSELEKVSVAADQC